MEGIEMVPKLFISLPLMVQQPCIYFLPITLCACYIYVRFCCCFLGSCSKMYCDKLAFPSIHIPLEIIWVGVHIDVFTWHYNFLLFNCHPNPHHWVYITWNPNDAFTGSFLDIVFCQYVKQEMGKNATKNEEWVCHCHFLLRNLAHGGVSVSWIMRVWIIKLRYL